VGGRSLPLALAALAVAAGLVGCTAGTERSEVQQVAVDFVTAIEDGNGQVACGLLTTEAEESVSGATEVSCETAVLNIDESGSDVQHIQVWGDAAQVKLGSDTVFLQRLPAGWQVRAAGCQSRPDAAYNCDVEG
jgi:hypothetical protein